jgi:hypothetical protein
MNENNIRKNIRDLLISTKGCIIEILMKDNHTLGHNPDNVKNWVKIVRQEIDRVYK